MAHGLQLERNDPGEATRWRAACRCGWVGTWTGTQRQAREEYSTHRWARPSEARG